MFLLIGKVIDYDKLIDKFGCSATTKEHIERYEKIVSEAQA